MRSLFLIISFLLAVVSILYGQKLPFENYGVDRGLIQLQVQAIAQDKQRHLWIGTFGGLDRFDGSSFTHFTKTEGLRSSSITSLYIAKNGNIWTAGFKGISCYDGFKITNYAIPDSMGIWSIITITEDDEGTIWAFSPQKGLLTFYNNQFIQAALPFKNAIPTCLYRSKKGLPIVHFFKNGLYAYEKKSWTKISGTAFLKPDEFIASITEEGEYYFALSNKKCFLKFSGDKMLAKTILDLKDFSTVTAGNNNEIWIGTDKGVQVISTVDLSVLAIYDASSGLSDNFINYIYRDAEGNMWIASDGDGLFKFSGNTFAKFDKSTGLPGNIVMGIVNSKKGFFIGTREAGMARYNASGKTMIPIAGNPSFSHAGINCLATDSSGNIFIGTMDNRLLKYNGTAYHEIIFDSIAQSSVNSIVCQGNKIWLATSGGCYVISNNLAKKIGGIDVIALSIWPLPNGDVFACTINGLHIIRQTHAQKVSNTILQNEEINCIASYKDYFLIGTVDDGLCLWKPGTDKVYWCNVANGLADNQVFSILVDRKQNIWVGTATTLQQVIFDEKASSFTVKQFSRADGYENSESNLNTIVEDAHGQIWIGTTKGAFIYNTAIVAISSAKPFTVIQDVSFPVSGKGRNTRNVSASYSLPESPRLSYANNSISFNVKGIYFKNPDGIRYSCQLLGYDKEFSLPSPASYFNYRNLEPGKYIFRVKTITDTGIESENIAEYTFSIITPFHKSKWFLALIIATLILTGVLVQILVTRLKFRKQEQLENFRQQEQEKIRQRTAEDFHDELGNKLTRISLLADILKKKTNDGDSEKNNIINQIQEDVKELYLGTKDIIWALAPGNDHLQQVLKRIQQFGNELFDDSEVEFSFNGIEDVPPDIIPSMNYSRNLTMIFKELLNNSLRHSGCSKVVVEVSKTSEDECLISFADNGKGFDPAHIKRGNGITNIQKRADRLQADIRVQTSKNNGTRYILRLKIPQKGG